MWTGLASGLGLQRDGLATNCLGCGLITLKYVSEYYTTATILFILSPYPHMHCMQVWNLCNCMLVIICSNQKTVEHIKSSLSLWSKLLLYEDVPPLPPTNVPWSSYINRVWMVYGTRKRLSPYDHKIPLTVFPPSSAILRKTGNLVSPHNAAHFHLTEC